MKIRPLRKVGKGYYISNDGEWSFIEKYLGPNKRNNPGSREWFVYQMMLDGKFYKDTPYFFESYHTLKSLIKALEKAKP